MVDDCCKSVGIMQTLGAFGSSFFDGKRMIFMGVTTILACLSWILTIVAMAGSSVDNDTVKSCAWTVEERDGFDIYFGTYRFVLDPSSATLPNTNYKDCTGDLCNDCEAAGITANNCAVLTFVMLFFFIALSIVRVFPAWDKIMFKATFVILSLVNILVMIIGMGSWDDQCSDKHITEGEVHLGPGLNCYVAVFFFLLFGTAIHLFTPVAAEGSSEASGGGEGDSYKPYEETHVNDK